MNRGGAFLLKIGFGDQVVYSTIAGMKVLRLTINGEPVGLNQIGRGAWRELLAGSGTRSVDVEASGIFTGSSAEAQAKSHALAGTIQPYELSFEMGDKLQGCFMITKLEYTGDFNGERNYEIALASSGEVVAG